MLAAAIIFCACKRDFLELLEVFIALDCIILQAPVGAEEATPTWPDILVEVRQRDIAFQGTNNLAHFLPELIVIMGIKRQFRARPK